MKQFIFALIALIALSCTVTEPITDEAAVVELPPVENVNPLFFEDGVAMKKKVETFNNERRGKPINKVAKRTIDLNPQPATNARVANTHEFGNIMLDPKDYTGELPLFDNFGFVDWDNDGEVDDQIVIDNRCYFPRTFSTVSVLLNGTDEHIINYTIAYGAKLLGFVDYDLDGDQDIIFEGGNHWLYNGSTRDVYTPLESYSKYNVGENVFDQYPISTKEIIQSLAINTSDPNPEAITWDLSQYGYSAYAFHVYLYNKALNDGFGYQQTTTYGEWGFYTLNRLAAGETYVLSFTNLADECGNVTVEFTL